MSISSNGHLKNGDVVGPRGSQHGEYTKGFWELSSGKTEKQLVSQRHVTGAQFWTILVTVGNSCGLI